MVDLKKLKSLREETGVSIALCNKALTESKGDIEKAKKLLSKWGVEIAGKKAGKETGQGIVVSYIHHNSRMGAMIVLKCETDFVARNDEFKKLGYEIAMQVASMSPKTTEELLAQDYIRDNSKKISDLVKGMIAKLGENIQIGEFVRLTI